MADVDVDRVTPGFEYRVEVDGDVIKGWGPTRREAEIRSMNTIRDNAEAFQ